MQDQDPKDIEKDVESDPALDGGDAVDWSSEGGATADGPATDTETGTDTDTD